VCGLADLIRASIQLEHDRATKVAAPLDLTSNIRALLHRRNNYTDELLHRRICVVTLPDRVQVESSVYGKYFPISTWRVDVVETFQNTVKVVQGFERTVLEQTKTRTLQKAKSKLDNFYPKRSPWHD
jgi:hypothetical protein